MVSFVPQTNESIQYGATLKMHIAGAESNTAIGVQKLGHSASFITRLGDDSFGQYILRMIRAENVDTSGIIIDSEHQTGIMFKEPLFNRETTVHYYRSDSAASFLCPSDIPEALISEAGILHFTGITPILSKSCRETIFSAIETASASGCAVSFDPNIRMKLWKHHDHSGLMKELVEKCNYLLIGLAEAKLLYGTENIEELTSAIFSSGNVKYLAIKNGSSGAWVCEPEQTLYIPPLDCQCIDPVGAGDAFNAGFLSGILKEESLSVCGSLAAISGAKATETSGDIEGLITMREIENILNHISPVHR